MSHWRSIFDEIRSEISAGKLKPGDRITPEIELAQQHRVSRQTANRAIVELQRLGLVVRQRRTGTTVSPGSAKQKGRVALIFDTIAKEYDFPRKDLLNGIQDTLGEETALIWCDSRNSSEHESRHLKTMLIDSDGVIIYPVSDDRNRAIYQRYLEKGIPCVFLDRNPTGLEAPLVTSDDDQATLKVMKLLLNRGHQRIAFLGFEKPKSQSVHNRYTAYQRALQDIGINDSHSFERWFPADLEHNHIQQFQQFVRDAVFSLSTGPESVTAFFCVQDMFAVAVLQACEDLGLDVPGKVEIATFNDWPAVMLRRPWNIHRIVPNAFEIGATAARLHEQLRNGEEVQLLHKIPGDILPAE